MVKALAHTGCPQHVYKQWLTLRQTLILTLIGCFDLVLVDSCKWPEEHWVEYEEPDFLIICIIYYQVILLVTYCNFNAKRGILRGQ